MKYLLVTVIFSMFVMVLGCESIPIDDIEFCYKGIGIGCDRDSQ